MSERICKQIVQVPVHWLTVRCACFRMCPVLWIVMGNRQASPSDASKLGPRSMFLQRMFSFSFLRGRRMSLQTLVLQVLPPRVQTIWHLWCVFVCCCLHVEPRRLRLSPMKTLGSPNDSAPHLSPHTEQH